jgi:hypothetical protein
VRATIWSVLAGVLAGAIYTVSPLSVWTAALAFAVFRRAGFGLPESEARVAKRVLAAAFVVRIAAITALFILNTPKHDAGAVSMLTGDEAYGMSRALRTRDVVLGTATTQYDYFVAYDEYGDNSYVSRLTALQLLFGPTPYSMRLLNCVLFTIAAVLLFRIARAGFGALAATSGLIVMLFVPTLFLWSISLLKESLYLLGSTLILSGALGAWRARTWVYRLSATAAMLAGVLVVRGLRPGAIALASLGLLCGFGLWWSTSSVRRLALTAAAGLAIAGVVVFQPLAQQRVIAGLETAAKAHSGHVFTVGHSYKLLDEGFYFSPQTPIASTLTLSAAEAARFVIRGVLSFFTVPWPWELASARELPYLPEQLLWYALVVLLPIGIVSGWRRDPLVTCMFVGYVVPTATALALTNGNVGTLLRLRGTVTPYLIWPAVVGFLALLQMAGRAGRAGRAGWAGQAGRAGWEQHDGD